MTRKIVSLICNVHQKNGKIKKIYKLKKRVFLTAIGKIDAKKVDHYHLIINYLPGVSNEAECFTKKELLEMYSIFTSEEEIGFILDYWGDERPVAIL